jgi:hypothetical protein
MDHPRSIQRPAHGTHGPVDHPAGGHHLSTGAGLLDGQTPVGPARGFKVRRTIAAVDAAVPMLGVRAETDIGDEQQFGHFGTQASDRFEQKISAGFGVGCFICRDAEEEDAAKPQPLRSNPGLDGLIHREPPLIAQAVDRTSERRIFDDEQRLHKVAWQQIGLTHKPPQGRRAPQPHGPHPERR